MSNIGLSLISALLLTVAVAGPRTMAEKGDAVNPNGPLVLDTSAISRRLCSGDEVVSVLQLKLKLHYTNVGRKTIILYKGSAVVPALTVSKTAEDALAGKTEVSLSFNVLTSRGQGVTQTSGEQFVTLRPGSSFDTEAQVAIPFTLSATEQIPGTVTPGRHFLRVQVVTWPETTEYGKRLQGRWQKKGYLWLDVIESAPMEFDIEPHAELEKCA